MPSYLAIPGIAGDSSAEQHRGELDVDIWGFGCSVGGPTNLGSGMGSGRAQFTEATFSCRGGRASPLLLEFCATQRAVAEAVLTRAPAGEPGGTVAEVRFADVRVTGYTVLGTEDYQRDDFRLSFSKVTFTMKVQRDDGSIGAPVTTTQPMVAGPVAEPPVPTPGSGGVWRPRPPIPKP